MIKRKKFKITHTGLYKTRDGRRALVSFISDFVLGIFGVIEGESIGSRWSENGKIWHGGKHPEDIVAEWEVYKEPKKKFEITHTGLYKTRKGRKAFVSCEVKYPITLKAPFFGIVEGGLTTRWWTKTGKNLCEPFEDGKEFDIVAEWES